MLIFFETHEYLPPKPQISIKGGRTLRHSGNTPCRTINGKKKKKHTCDNNICAVHFAHLCSIHWQQFQSEEGGRGVGADVGDYP